LPGDGAPHEAEVISAQGYEPFGSLMPGRNYSSGSYRHLFQGQEHDDEINGGVGTSYAFEYRIHDPRIGRFLSIDPLAFYFPWNSPYAFSENRVLDMVELEGLEAATTPDKAEAEDPKWGLPDGGEGWTEGTMHTFPDGTTSRSFNGPTPEPNGGLGSTSPSIQPSANSGGLLHPKPRSSSLRGPTLSQGRPNYALSYEVPSLGPKVNAAFKVVGDFANAGRLMMTVTQHSLRHSAANTQFRYGAAKSTGRLTSVSNTTLTRATKIQLTSASNVAKTIGRGFGIFGAGVTTIQSIADGNYTLGDFAKTSVGLVTTFTPYGWAYGAVDLGFSLYFGKSLTDRLGEWIDD
ncbi:MAG TPA: RHS repeat-associated core domain-containing protein, partial [Candidatus Nanoperiomorbaceae bacterium]|nr:RHS repeat-associated core domain-containing protein [Candidatus Nanoperiomorbaceae bacterium]